VILVTGGTGFVGGHVVHAIRADGKDVRCLVRDRRRAETLRAWGCELADGDVTNPASVRAAVAGCDTVVHLVAIRQGREQDFQRVMIQGTRDLIAAAKTAHSGAEAISPPSDSAMSKARFTPSPRRSLATVRADARD